MKMIRPGLTGERKTIVVETLMATHLGSGSVPVYATPAMIALMEAAAVAAIDPLLPNGRLSVGIAVDVKHLAATSLGGQIRAQAEVTAVDGRKVTFTVRAWDENALVGEGTHTRIVVDGERFVQRAQSRAGQSSS